MIMRLLVLKSSYQIIQCKNGCQPFKEEMKLKNEIVKYETNDESDLLVLEEKTKETGLTKRIKEKLMKIGLFLYLSMWTLALSTQRVYGADGTEKIDGFMNFVSTWIQKIGGVVAFVGAIMFAISYQREDADGKSKALFTVMSGFMITALATSYNMFF